MKPVASPLKITDFALTNLEYELIPPKKLEDTNAAKFFDEYDLDLDFGMDKQESHIRVFIKAEVNQEKKLPGYRFIAEAVCFFEFNTQMKIGEEVRNSIEGFSTIYIALNSLRGLISNFTANAPFGRYILPSIDLNDLIEQKKKSLTKNTPAKRLPAKTGKTRKAI